MEHSINKLAYGENRPSILLWNRPRQFGVVLFFALIALVVMSLAAVALIRSVDTGTIIAGNLAFRQAATASGDSGVEAAIGWLEQINTANAGNDPTKIPGMGSTMHPFNLTNAAAGYYSYVNPNMSMTDDATWADGVSASAGTDESGNSIRYIIQRMCRIENQILSAENCLMSDITVDNSGKQVKDAPKACRTCFNNSFLPPLYRVTVRVTGPKNTVSYVQAFVY